MHAIRSTKTVLVSLTLSLILMTPSAFAQGASNFTPEWVQRSNEIAYKILESTAQFAPEFSGQTGVSGYDEEIFDLGDKLFERQIAVAEQNIVYLNELLAQEEDSRVAQDIEIMLQSQRDQIEANTINYERVLPYGNITGLVFAGFNGLLDKQVPLELYKLRLKNWGVYDTPEELMKTGQVAFMNIRNEMMALAPLVAAEKGFDTSDYREVITHLKEDQVHGDALMERYRATMAELDLIIAREGLVSLPDEPARARMATATESAQQPAAHLDVPRLVGNTGEFPEFIVPLIAQNEDGSWPASDYAFPAMMWTLAAHEARPGHMNCSSPPCYVAAFPRRVRCSPSIQPM